MKILVTGGEGFVGYHLLKRLLDNKEYLLTSLDCNLANNISRRLEGVEYIQGDTQKIQEIFAGRNFDIIFHLGEYSRVENSFDNIEQTIASNVHGTAEVLEFWREQKCKLLYAGSSTKFSSNFVGKDSSPYAFTKATNTELVQRYAEWFSLPYVITYFYNVYGPMENEDGTYATLIGIFKKRKRQGDSLKVVLPGTQKRNFTHVDDIVSGLVIAGERGSGDDYGIGAEEESSILEVANMFGGEIEYLPERRGNRLTAELHTEKIKKLGWEQKNTLYKYIEYLKNNSFND